MAYSTTAHITTGQLKTALERVKTEYTAADEELVVEAASEEVATDDEVAEMLDEVFAASTDEDSSDSTDNTSDTDGTEE